MSTLTKNTWWVNEPVADDFSASSNQRATLTVKCACTCMYLYGLYYLVKVKVRATLTFIWNINVDSCKRSFWKKALHIPKHLPHWMVNQPANGDSISRDKKTLHQFTAYVVATIKSRRMVHRDAHQLPGRKHSNKSRHVQLVLPSYHL